MPRMRNDDVLSSFGAQVLHSALSFARRAEIAAWSSGVSACILVNDFLMSIVNSFFATDLIISMLFR